MAASFDCLFCSFFIRLRGFTVYRFYIVFIYDFYTVSACGVFTGSYRLLKLGKLEKVVEVCLVRGNREM